MERVCSALADDVDLACAEPILGGVDAALYLEFPDRILGKNHRRGHHRLVRIYQAVQGVVVSFGAAAVDADGIAFTLAHRALLATHGNRTGADQQQLHKVAPVQRKVSYLLPAHFLRQGGCVRVQSHRLRSHLQRFRYRSRL